MSPTSQSAPIFHDFHVFFCAYFETPQRLQRNSLGGQFEASGAHKPSKVTPRRSQKKAKIQKEGQHLSKIAAKSSPSRHDHPTASSELKKWSPEGVPPQKKHRKNYTKRANTTRRRQQETRVKQAQKRHPQRPDISWARWRFRPQAL